MPSPSGCIKLDQMIKNFDHVDLIRTVAIVGVILVHASGSWALTTQQMSQMSQLDSLRWGSVFVYQSIGRIGVPLFAMLTGTLLLQPAKVESVSTFLKKRFIRIGLPFIFWGILYFAWDFAVMKIQFSPTTIIQGVLNGPYTHFWYLYLLAGIYLLVPLLRVLVTRFQRNSVKYVETAWFLAAAFVPIFAASASSLLSVSAFAVTGIVGAAFLAVAFLRAPFAGRKLIDYSAFILFLGVVAAPVFSLVTHFTLSTNVFAVLGFAGYLVLGVYLTTVQIKRSTILLFMILGIASTAMGTYALGSIVGGSNMYFLQQYFSPTIILSSAMAFLMVLKNKSTGPHKEAKSSKVNKLLKTISQNTLPIFMFHVMFLESLQNGYFGIAINRNTLNPIIEIPLMTVIVLFVSLAVVLLLKKIPYFQRLVG